MYYQNQSNLSFHNFLIWQNRFFFRSKDRIVNSQSKITRWALKKLPLTENRAIGKPF